MQKNVVAIIQARLTSTRLPKKILAPIEGKPMIEHVIDRVKKAMFIKKIVVASPQKLPLELDVPIFYGSEDDVLSRYYFCAKKYRAEIIVRITSDCPLLDPTIIEGAIWYFHNSKLPYVVFAPVDGLDVEVFTPEILEEAYIRSKDREHVTTYMREVTKCSVDTEEDLRKVRHVFHNREKRKDPTV